MKLLGALPTYLQPVITFVYKTGWRKSEILGLTWEQADLKEGTVRLEAGDSKNEESRSFYLDGELKALIKAQMAQRQLGCPYVFHKDGNPIRDFRSAWKTACKIAVIKGKLFHDLRRTAVRNMVRAGIPERVAMMISGHKSRSVFERYNIVSPEDLKLAAAKQEAYLQSQTGTVLGTIGENKATHRSQKGAQVVEINK